MPSPFPGMDPYVETRSWATFHFHLIASLSDALVPAIRPRYALRVEDRVYLEHETEAPRHIRPDITVIHDGGVPLRGERSAVATVAAPVVVALPVPEEVLEHYLTIQHLQTEDVVTVIEVLSPGNKRKGSDGRRE